MNFKKIGKLHYAIINQIQRPFYKSLSLSARIHPLSHMRGHKRISIGDQTRIGAHSELIADSENSFITIGSNCYIFPYTFLMPYGGFIKIGGNCSVNPFCILYGHGGLTIGNDVRIAANTIIIPSNHIFDDINTPIYKQSLQSQGIVIEDNVWIAAHVTILDGVRIGHGAIIAAGAVVSKDVEPNHVVGGVPARTIKIRK